jgi:hypothetical protein
MTSIEAGPVRLATPRAYQRPPFPACEVKALPRPKAPRESLLSALLQRRSADSFLPIDLNLLATWLYFSHAVQSVNEKDHNRQRRYVPSFGALHVNHVVLGWPDHSWFVYLPEKHALGKLTVDVSAARKLRESTEDHCTAPDAVLVLLLSNLDLASAYYDHYDDLVAREAGVLFGHASLLAAGLGVAFRILGSTGSPWAERLIPDLPFRGRAAGTSWIGASKIVVANP